MSNLPAVLEAHRLWATGAETGGCRANLHGANLSEADLHAADLSEANLHAANLSEANLSEADLHAADLSGANLSGANLSGANLSGANLHAADLSGANLSEANLSEANLRGADLSGAVGLLDPIDWLATHLEQTQDGYVAYKMFETFYATPARWIIQAGSVLTEVCQPDRCLDCGCGINVATRDWAQQALPTRTHPLWRCLIRWAWLSGVVVPFGSDGKIRCSRVELVGEVTP